MTIQSRRGMLSGVALARQPGGRLGIKTGRSRHRGRISARGGRRRVRGGAGRGARPCGSSTSVSPPTSTARRRPRPSSSQVLGRRPPGGPEPARPPSAVVSSWTSSPTAAVRLADRIPRRPRRDGRGPPSCPSTRGSSHGRSRRGDVRANLRTPVSRVELVPGAGIPTPTEQIAAASSAHTSPGVHPLLAGLLEVDAEPEVVVDLNEQVGEPDRAVAGGVRLSQTNLVTPASALSSSRCSRSRRSLGGTRSAMRASIRRSASTSASAQSRSIVVVAGRMVRLRRQASTERAG